MTCSGAFSGMSSFASWRSEFADRLFRADSISFCSLVRIGALHFGGGAGGVQQEDRNPGVERIAPPQVWDAEPCSRAELHVRRAAQMASRCLRRRCSAALRAYSVDSSWDMLPARFAREAVAGRSNEYV